MAVYTDPNKLKKDADKAFDKIANFFDNTKYVKLGILGEGNSRMPGEEDSSNGITNAELGFIHEFGSATRGIPIRSWLRMPIIEKVKDIINSLVKRKKQNEKEVSEGKDPIDMYKFLGVKAEAVIQEAFDTGGFGKWDAKKPTKNNEGKMSPLIISAQMRKSVSSTVEDNL